MTRSYLFVPGDRPERFDKACAAGAGMVIVDLEDAVAPPDKQAARDAVADWLRADRPVALRINASDTAWFDDDLALCGHAAVAAVVLPKAERVEPLQRVRSAAPHAVLLPLIETARGIANAQALAAADGVQRLLFGSIDFQLDLGISGDGEELLFFRSQLVLASRLAQIEAPVDGVSTALDDAAQLRADTLRARRLGFGAKLCIHPKQVPVVNAAFAPTAQEIEWAKRVLEAAEQSQGAAVALDGRMVDKPVILRAQSLLRP
jgi:citrate lyase subunit beta/citryl-CoA lyase